MMASQNLLVLVLDTEAVVLETGLAVQILRRAVAVAEFQTAAMAAACFQDFEFRYAPKALA